MEALSASFRPSKRIRKAAHDSPDLRNRFSRDQAQSRIDATPSLKRHAPELFAKAWQQARRAAQKSFELYDEQVQVPADCPYSIEQVLDPDYFPGSQQASK